MNKLVIDHLFTFRCAKLILEVNNNWRTLEKEEKLIRMLLI